MKTFFKSKAKKLIAMALAVITMMSVIPLSGITAFAMSTNDAQTVSSKYSGKYVSYDGKMYYQVGGTHYAMSYNSDGSTHFIDHTSTNSRTKMSFYSGGEERQVMCVEYGTDFEVGTNTYHSQNGDNSNYFNMLPLAARRGIMLASVYGWQPGKSLPISGINEDDFSFATQTIIWECQQNVRTTPTTRVDNGPIKADQFYNDIKGRPAEKAYNWILSQMAAHLTVPSFTTSDRNKAQTHTLKYDPATKKYSLTLTDTNNTGAAIKMVSGSGVSVSKSGNQYTFTSNSMITNAVNFECKKDITLYGDPFLIWGDVGYQTMVSGVSDPVSFFMNINTETYGTGKIVKTSEDGKVSGISFNISGNGVNKDVTTGSNGQVSLELLPGVYTVTEQNIDKYEPQSVQRVTILSGQTSTVTFNNVLKRGELKVTKTSEDGLVENVKFHLYGTSLSGLAVDAYAITDKNGVATFKDVLISGSSPYTLEEVDTAIKYVVPMAQTAAIEWNKVTNKSVINILKKFNVTVTKSDTETGTAQGDASLSGAVYGIYNDGALVDTYTTDKNGQFTTAYYVCGENWTVREIKPSEGYLLDPTVHKVGASPKLFTVERNSVANNVNEQVKKGKIALIKHTDDGSTKIETPEIGAEFEVYLEKSGSYARSKASERDYLVCDENGFAQTKNLPYGVYIVHQTKGWDGREKIKDFRVFVSADGFTYRYIINNANFESYIKVVKKDAESGKTIPYAGAGFQLYRPDGSLVKMTFTYPTVTTIDTFYTNESGYLITPEKLEYGKGYSLVEVAAPYGYVLDKTPVYFDVTQDNSTEENAVTVIKVDKPNMAQKGVINITKTGEVFSTVTENGGIYQPVYEVKGLKNAVYSIRAAEDIYTPDGTLRAKKGEIVDTITTGKNGLATSKRLYLGCYEVFEMSAPFGMIINTEVHSVELSYAGQEVAVTDTATSFYNERQKVEISLNKSLEQDEKFGIGMNGEIFDVTFGLYATADLAADDGTVIPKDGLIEIVSVDKDGNGVCKTDLPIGSFYLKELSTNENYQPSDKEYPVIFDYAGQDTALVKLTANDGKSIQNDIIRGRVDGLKIDRETEETIAGAVFGLFSNDAKEFTEETALLTATSAEDGSFSFENVPFGKWIIRELSPAEGFLPNEESYSVQISKNAEIIEISVVNDRIPEIGTTATIDGEKEVNATEVFTLEDIVSYKHLIPGKEYVLKGVLMDKSTGNPLLIDGKEVRSEVTFIPETPSGEVVVTFTFDVKFIKSDTDIVVFENLYRDGKELTVHADIEDEGQTVTVRIPKIGTKASVGGKKEVTATDNITIDDTVSYTNLTPGKEYVLKGLLMDKATGQPLLINGKQVHSEIVFVPDTTDGEIVMSFTFDASGFTTATEIVVFETLYREGVEIAAHADIEDEGQTVKITPPAPEIPQTGDDSNFGFWIGLGGIALGGLIAFVIIYLKQKKDDDNE